MTDELKNTTTSASIRKAGAAVNAERWALAARGGGNKSDRNRPSLRTDPTPLHVPAPSEPQNACRHRRPAALWPWPGRDLPPPRQPTAPPRRSACWTCSPSFARALMASSQVCTETLAESSGRLQHNWTFQSLHMGVLSSGGRQEAGRPKSTAAGPPPSGGGTVPTLVPRIFQCDINSAWGFKLNGSFAFNLLASFL